MSASLIPWPEVVKLHQQSQGHLLEIIGLYERLRDDPETPEDTRNQLQERIRYYRHAYLGLQYQEKL